MNLFYITVVLLIAGIAITTAGRRPTKWSASRATKPNAGMPTKTAEKSPTESSASRTTKLEAKIDVKTAEKSPIESTQVLTSSKQPNYGEAAKSIVAGLSQSAQHTEALLASLMSSVKKDPGTLITQDMIKSIMKQQSLAPQKAGTRSIRLTPDQGFNGFSNYQPSGWKITETTTEQRDKSALTTDEKAPVYSYPKGLGTVLANGCTDAEYPPKSPCYGTKKLGHGQLICPRMMKAAAYIGVGFDGRGFYKIESRKASLVQRACSKMATFMGRDVPDTMSVFGIFETSAETKSFQSADEYMRFIQEKAGLSKQKNLFRSESTQHSESSGSGMSLAAIGTVVGGVIGAKYGGAEGASQGANMGNAIGGLFGGGSAKSKSEATSNTEGSSKSEYTQTDESSTQQSSSNSFFATLYISVIQYEMSLDEVKPRDINFAALRDYMRLPMYYYAMGSDVKYQNFLLRWGTHFIRSAKFGGQLKITKTAKSDKIQSAQQFSSIAETEFQSMFATLQSKSSQESSSFSFFGYKKESAKAVQSSSASSESTSESTMNHEAEQSKSFRQSEFTHTSVEAQGGSPTIAEALLDFYTPGFKQLYHEWIVSIKDYVKPFEFQLRPLEQLFDMNMDDLFPSGKPDLGCIRTRKPLQYDSGGNSEDYFNYDSDFTINREMHCKYNTSEDFRNEMERRRTSLEAAVAVYMAEGPFPTSSYEVDAGQPGCEEASVAKFSLVQNSSQPLTFAELSKAPFLISFDMPQEIPNVITRQAKYAMVYKVGRWFATEPRHEAVHLYDGCQLWGYNDTDHKICFRNIILTYEQTSGFFYITRPDFIASKRRIPILPNWLSGSTIAKASRLQPIEPMQNTAPGARLAVPCNVKWMNSHRLDGRKEVNCIHFTAASEGDIFVTFSSIPRDHTTWIYLQITTDGVAYYKAMQLQKRELQKGMGILGDKNLYQSLFVCITQKADITLMEYGKSSVDSEVSKVYSSHKFQSHSQYNPLSFYTFGSGSRAVSLMDIRLTVTMPKVKCINKNSKYEDGHCVPFCHPECDECSVAFDDKACYKCRHVRVTLKSAAATGSTKLTQCLMRCPAGHELSKVAEHLCVGCQAGMYKSFAGNEDCMPCTPGTYSKPNSQECTKCPLGSYSNVSGQSQCQSCPVGHFSDQLGQTTCAACPSGSFSAMGSPRCTECDTDFALSIEAPQKAFCYHKVSGFCEPKPECEKVSDLDRIGTFGLFRDVFTIYFPAPVRMRKIVVYKRPDCCAQEAQNLAITAMRYITWRAAIRDGITSQSSRRPTEKQDCSTGKSSFFKYLIINCYLDNTEAVIVAKRDRHQIMLNEIEFYGV